MTEQKNFLRNIWYYALPGRQLKPGQMFAKQLLGEPIVFGRTHSGEVFALRDICPHRAVPLSCGRFDGTAIAQEDRLRGWLARRGDVSEAEPEYAFYNSPIIPGPLRRNEVWLPLN